ncbi:hypothetical protein [Streptomyces neyagawaensis]|uniref:hypothetical protein n=1 Tax=Streptomyces neyagawaensis TaxID=42238 RepID=UPI000A6D0B48|nr:hypothetical protein [Streptomyces neyagawaensis]MCL6737488.1 hypothetical protein [Streptomyces neyagawaensis]MDE1688228.1 hypothetical protein [Streptomyces neyagawaensis]
MGWHTTYFARLYNYTNKRWNVVDLESPTWPLRIVEPSSTIGLSFKEFPWCSDNDDILLKAFRFNSGGDANSGGGRTEFYLYQDYTSHLIFSFSGPGEPQRRMTEAAETVNVYLNADASGGWDGQVEVVKS